MTFIHWHVLKKELSSDSAITTNPDEVTCEACKEFISENPDGN